MRVSVLAFLLLGAVGSVGCGAEIDYVPRTAEAHAALDPSDVEVYTAGKPDWDYEAVGSFREQSADAIPGGRPGVASLLRELGAERGCDAVIMGGNVSRFDGEYTHHSSWSFWTSRRDRRRASSEWVPVFEHFGIDAVCVVRVDRTASSPHPPFNEWQTPYPF